MRLRLLSASALVLPLLGLPSFGGAQAHPVDPVRTIVRMLERTGAPTSGLSDDVGGPATPITRRYSFAIPRATLDRPDEVEGRQIHVVYLLPSDATDEKLDTLGVIDLSMQAQNDWMAQQTGGAQRWRLDTVKVNGKRVVDVTLVRASASTASMVDLADVKTALVAAGLNNPNKRYLAYAAMRTGGVCGEAYYPLAGWVFGGPVDGQYSALYLDSSPGCGARNLATSRSRPLDAEAIAMQEMIHNDGVVPANALHACATNPFHICTPGLAPLGSLDPASADVMFPYVTGPLHSKGLDPGRDDYYNAPLATLNLAESWYLTR